MAVIEVRGFAGERPLLHPTLLGDGEAQVARNCRFEGGRLSPLKGTSTVQALASAATVQALHRYAPDKWFEWDADVDAVPAPIANDAYDRVIYTGDGEPKVTYNAVATGSAPYPTVSYRLGVPAPDTAPTAVVTGSADNANDLAETRFYIVTYVDVFGAEGPPSAPTSEVEWRPGQTVELADLPTAPTGNYNIQAKRLYRVNTGESGSVYQYVTDLGVATASYSDTVASADLGEALPTLTFDMPHKDLRGVTAHPNGFLVGFYDNVLCFSEPGHPHAWPIDYQLTLNQRVVAVKALGSTVVVMTDGHPAVAAGVHPSSMTLSDLEIGQACVSKRGAVDTGSAVIYPSPDGLVSVTPSGPSLVSSAFFRRSDWQALKPSSIHAYVWEGLYVAFYDTGSEQGGFLFDPAAPEAGVVFMDLYATAGFQDLEQDTLYLAVDGDLVEWGAGSELSLTWKSKLFRLPQAMNLGAAKVTADGYPVTLKLYADGELATTRSVQSSRAVRLPGGYRAERIEVQLEGKKAIHGLTLASTMREMAAV